MRKRTISHLCDSIFWYLIYALPFLAYGIQLINGEKIISLSTFLTQADLITSENLVFSALNGIFGTGGILPLFNNSALLFVCSWFVSVFLVHIAVDFLLFIPRFAHNAFESFYKGDMIKNEKD